MNTLKQQVLRYLAAMNASALQSAIHALRGYCGIAGVHEITIGAAITIPAINVQQAAVLFLFTFGSAILNYLDAHPVANTNP